MADTNDIQKRRAALLTSFGVNPDEVAEINRKAASLKVPVGVVKEMPQTANSRLKLDQIEAQIGGLTILPKRLSDPEFSDIAHDDISQLSEIERKRGVMTAGKEDNFFVDLYRSVARGWYTGKKNLNGLIVRSDLFGLEKQREAAAKAAGTYYNRNLDIAQQQAQHQREIDKYAPDATLQRQQRELGSQTTLSGSASYLVRNPSLLFNTSAESLGQNALGLAAGAATGGLAAVGTVGFSSGAQEYAATMEEVLEKHAHELGGMTPTERYAYALSREDWMAEAKQKAWKRGISIGLFDAATAGLAGRLLGGATGKLSAAARTAGEAGIQAGGGAAGEATAQALTGEYKPGDIIMEAFAEIPTGAFEARSNYKEARAQMESRQAQAKAAEEARAHLKEQAMAVTSSRMTQRDPDKQAAFVNDVYGEDQKIYFDGGALMQSGRAAAVAQAMPDMAAKIQEAAETGGMVEMTRGDFHARLTQEDQNALAEIAMETPDSITAAEAEEIRKSGFDAMMDEAYQADLTRHQEEQAQAEQDRRVAEFEAFKEEAKAQLTATGIMDGAQAEANATLYARAVETLAGRLNMGIRDFDAAYGGLNVVGESLIDDGVLNQALASNPPRGWVHSENPQDAADLWNGNNKAEAVFWTNGNPRLAGEFPALEGYSHSVSKADINHIKKEHGDAQAEAARGQIAITDKDIARIPDIVSDYGAIRDDLVSEQGSKRIMFAKSFDDGTVVYLGQVSRKKKDIKTVSMWKYPSAIDEQRAIEIAVTSNQTFGTEAGISHKETVPDNSTPNADTNQDILFQSATEEQRQFSETATQYGGKAAYDQAKADGKTELTYRQWIQVRTPAFKAWFGDWENDPNNASKVVNPETGEPLVVYHGTDAEFNVFDRSKAGSNTDNGMRGKGFYMATDRRTAEGYGNRLIESFTDLKNPFYPSDFESAEAIAQYLTEKLEAKGFDEYTVDEAMFKIRDGRFTVGQSYSGTFAGILKDAGFDGVVYQKAEEVIAFRPNQIKSATDNTGAFSPENDSILYQGGTDRGMFSREHNLIALLKNADASTFVHELGHFFLETNTRIARDLTAKPAENLTGQERQFLSDVQTTLDWFGVKDLAAWDAMSLNEQRENHEKWARGFEAYLYEGKAPSEELRGVFRRFCSWLKQVYQSLKNLNVELTDEVRSVFDRMFASDEQIQQTQYINGMTPMFEDAAQAGMDDTDYAQYRHNTERATAEAQDDLTARALRDMAFIRNLRARKIREMRKQHKADFQRAEMAARGSIMSQPVYRAWQLLTSRMTEENRIGDGKPKFDKQVDAAHDSLFEAIAKLGGVNKDEMISQFGLDPKDKIPAVHIGYPVLRKTNGRSIDGMIEALTEEGYLPVDDTGKADPRDFEERFFDEMRGTKRYSSAYVPHEQKAGDHVANPYALTAVRFDHDSLVAMGVGGQTLERLIDFDMTRKNGGMHPDLVSDLILNEEGEPVFSGGEDLIRALTEAQPPQEAIEETAYLNILAEKGEVPTQADFEEAADLAAHSEIRQRIIAAEFKALSKATGAASLIRKAASVYAKEKVEQIKVRDLRPSVYTRAEAKAAKASMEAFRKGDIPTAATQKRNQLLQNSMAREVLKAREEMESARKYLGKFNRVVKSIDIEYREQIEALLESVELSNAPSLKDLDKRTSLLQFVKKMEEQGRTHNIDAEYIAEIQAKRNYREMTVEEMRVLVDTVKGIEHLGRLKNKMLTARDKRTYQEIRDKIVESIRDNARDHDKRTSTAANNIERVEDGFSGFVWGHIKISSIARILDGGKDAGAFWNYFIRPINEAADREATMTAETAQKLEEILKPLNDNLTHREYWRNAEYQIGGQKFTRRQLFAIALNLGNEGNIQRLLSGGHGSVRNWNMAEVMDAMQNLTSKEWQAVQKVWDLFESFRPQIAELERKVVGIEPQWVEAKPLTVRTADGEMLTLRGGYYPAKYDPASTQAAESGNALSDIEDIKSAVKMAANTRHSFTKDRAAAVKNRPLLLDLSVTYNGLNEIIHDLTHREAVIDAARLLKSSSIDKAIRETLGAQAKQQLNKALEDIARGNTAPVKGFDKFSGLLRQNVSMTGLGFNVVSAAVQLTGFIPAVARLGGKYAWAGLSQYTTHPIKATQSAMEQSEFMRNRGNTRLREIREVAATINGAGKIRKFLNKYSYWLMMKMQQVVDTAIWHGALAKAMDSGKDLDTAIKLADQTVLDTQGGGQIKDLSEFERGSNTQKLFTVFYAYMNTALNQGFVEAKTQKSKAKLTADLMMIYVVPTALTALMKSALIPGDDDDDLAKKLAKEQISFLLGLFVGGRELTQLANIATGDRFYGYTGPSGLRPIDDTFKLAQQAVQGEFDSAFVRASVNLLGDAFGLPSAQINRTIKGAQALQDDETDNPAALLFGYQSN
jgi:hypothetical protein